MVTHWAGLGEPIQSSQGEGGAQNSLTQQSQPKTKKLAVPGFSVSEGAGEGGGAKNRKDGGGNLGNY